MQEEREIRVVLYDGSEVIMNTEERVIFQAPRPGAIPLSVDADTVFDDVLITLNNANRQLTEKDGTIGSNAKLIEWIKSEMEAMGAPPAYSYQVGIYHGMERVLKKIENGEVDTAIEV